jgi:hypothetical protein
MNENAEIPANPRLCAHCHTAVARQNQRYCPACHAVTMKTYRINAAQQKASRELTRQQMDGNDLDTYKLFAQRVGRRRVLVIPDERDASQDYGALVVGFYPQERIAVLDEGGREHLVPLDTILPDPRREEQPSQGMATEIEIQSGGEVPDLLNSSEKIPNVGAGACCGQENTGKTKSARRSEPPAGAVGTV